MHNMDSKDEAITECVGTVSISSINYRKVLEVKYNSIFNSPRIPQPSAIRSEIRTRFWSLLLVALGELIRKLCWPVWGKICDSNEIFRPPEKKNIQTSQNTSLKNRNRVSSHDTFRPSTWRAVSLTGATVINAKCYHCHTWLCAKTESSQSPSGG